MKPDKLKEVGELAKRAGPENTADKAQLDNKIPKTEDVKNKIKDKVGEAKDAGSHLLGQAVSAASKMVSLPTSIPGLPTIDLGSMSKSSNQDGSNTRKLEEPIHKPGVFFIEGFSLNPFADGSSGLKAMADNIPSAKVFKWNEEDQIINAIKERASDQPIMLIGHGMGGDSAVNIANSLNSAEGNFRSVDLLVTLDSIGTDNDIIPQNVRKNFNVISDQDMLFNDGPNVAKRSEKTLVVNELREESHNEIESSPEVQFEVYDHINSVLMDAVKRKGVKDAQEKMTLEQAKILMSSFQTPSLTSTLSGQSLLSDM